MNEFVIQLDEEVEGMQATICVLQQQLKDEKQNTEKLEEENKTLKTRLEEVIEQQLQHLQQQQIVINESENIRTTPTIHSPIQTEIKEEINEHYTTDSNSTQKQSDHFSPPPSAISSSVSQEEEDLEVDEEGMEVDEKEYPIKIEPKVTVPEEQLPPQIESIAAAAVVVATESHPPMKKVKVITRQTAENLKNIENANNVPQHSMTTRGSNSSFSITDLLSHGKDSKKEKDNEKIPVAATTVESEENGDSTDSNGALNGEIDDSVI